MFSSRDKYLISRPPQHINPRPLYRWMPVPSYLFLAGVNRRKNTSIKNQSASQKLRLQGTPGQTGDLCPSHFSLILSLLLTSCHFSVPFCKVPRSCEIYFQEEAGISHLCQCFLKGTHKSTGPVAKMQILLH